MQINTFSSAVQAADSAFSFRSATGSSGDCDFASTLDAVATEEVPVSEETKPLHVEGDSGLMSSFLDGAGADGVITMEELTAFRDKHAAIAKEILGNCRVNLHIPASAKFSVTTDAQGKARVSGNLSSEDRQRLEDALNESKTFIDSFQAMASTATTIEAGKWHLKFAEAYAKDQKGAVARFNWLFGADWKCSLNYENGVSGIDVTCSALG